MTAATPSAQRRSSIAAISCGLAVAAAMIALSAPQLPVADPTKVTDGSAYYEMAEGHIDHVHRPFANRFLEPLVARAISAGAEIGLNASFLALGLLAVVVFCGSLAALEIRLTPWWFCALAPAIPFVHESLALYLLPDLLHAALGALFLLTLDKKSWRWCALILFVMQMTRESTLLLGGVAALVLLLRGDRRRAAALCAAMMLGMGLTAAATRGALPNIHGMPEVVYLALKAPFNFAAHYLGLMLWADSLPGAEALPTVWKWTLPAWAPTGKLRTIGFVGCDLRAPLGTLWNVLTVFGVFTSVVIVAAVRRGRAVARDYPSSVSVAIVYGLVAFFSAPMLGAWVIRLMGYGWPLLVAGPAILAQAGVTRRAALAILSIHLACAWLPALPWHYLGRDWGLAGGLVLGGCLHAAVVWMCWKKTGRPASPGIGPSPATR